MKHDFDTPVNRRNTDSLKWDVAENELPMWVADMDFKTAPEITEAIIKRAEHGIFGYTIVPDEWADAYINWWDKRHGLKMERDWLMFCTGVVACDILRCAQADHSRPKRLWCRLRAITYFSIQYIITAEISIPRP